MNACCELFRTNVTECIAPFDLIKHFYQTLCVVVIGNIYVSNTGLFNHHNLVQLRYKLVLLLVYYYWQHMHHQWLQAPNKRFSNEISEHSDPALPQVRKWIEVSLKGFFLSPYQSNLHYCLL